MGKSYRLRNLIKTKKKRKTAKKNKKNGLKILNFSVNFPMKRMIYTYKT